MTQQTHLEVRKNLDEYVLAMAIYDPDAKMLAKQSQDYGKLQGIEKAIAAVGLPAWHAAEAHKHNASLDAFIKHYREYIASGDHAAFSSWCNSHGYGTPPHPQWFISFEQPEDAVAWTTADKAKPIIGVNKYFRQRVQEYAANNGLSQKEVIEMVITHELFHIMQNDTVKKHGAAYTEQDCEMNLRDYYLHLRKRAASPSEKQKYWRMAKAANQRYHAWRKTRDRKVTATERKTYQQQQNAYRATHVKYNAGHNGGYNVRSATSRSYTTTSRS